MKVLQRRVIYEADSEYPIYNCVPTLWVEINVLTRRQNISKHIEQENNAFLTLKYTPY